MKIDHEAIVMERIKDKPGAHYCRDWDFLAIHDGDQEAEYCHCFRNSEKKKEKRE